MADILIVDDEPIFRLGLREFLHQKQLHKVIGEAGTGEEAITLAERLRPDVVIIDSCLSGTNGIEATVRILKHNPDIKVIALSRFETEQEIMDMLRAGSKGLIFKLGSASEILTALEKVMDDEEFYSKEAVQIIINRFAKGNPEVKNLLRLPGFSERETDIIRLICMQKTAKEIGQELFISEKTVDFHRQKIIEKMNVRNIIGLVLYAIKNNLINISELEIKTS